MLKTTHKTSDGVPEREQPRLSIPRVKSSEEPHKIYNAMLEAGCVIIEDFLSPEQVKALNNDLNDPFKNIQMGSKSDDEFIREFHGHQTKRVTNLVSHSKVFRNDVLDMDLVYDLCDLAFASNKSSYWMSAAQAIEINPGNKVQHLHRDQAQYAVFDTLGPDGPEAAVNFFIAITKFTEENGATRVIPGSHEWPDFYDLGHQDMTVPALMKAGDCMFMSGKTVHGGGENKTENESRRGLGFAFTLSYLTPEEAYPFQIKMDTVKTLSKRAQRMIGFRSVYPLSSGGLWQNDYSELADFLELDK
jgi:ectoine hydroxylase-related dioxygenase (phytanoyl-CoA dioxygenase family)